MKILVWALMLGSLGIGVASAQSGGPALRGDYFGRTGLVSNDEFIALTGTIQQTINDFRSRPRGTIRSSMVAAGSDGFALAARDLLRIRNGRLSMQTTFLSPCGCGGPGIVTLTGPAEVRRRSLSYSAVSADGNHSVRGSIRLTRNGMVRTETRTIYDPDFDETDVFQFVSRLYSQGRRGR